MSDVALGDAACSRSGSERPRQILLRAEPLRCKRPRRHRLRSRDRRLGVEIGLQRVDEVELRPSGLVGLGGILLRLGGAKRRNGLIDADAERRVGDPRRDGVPLAAGERRRLGCVGPLGNQMQEPLEGDRDDHKAS